MAIFLIATFLRHFFLIQLSQWGYISNAQVSLQACSLGESITFIEIIKKIKCFDAMSIFLLCVGIDSNDEFTLCISLRNLKNIQ